MFSTAQHTQRDPQSYIEKRRGRKEIEVTRRRRGGVKSGQTSPASNQFPKCSPHPQHTERFIELSREEKGEGGDRGELGRRGERAIKPVITPLNENGY